MSRIEHIFEASFRDAQDLLSLYVGDAGIQATHVNLAERIAATFQSGGKILIAGNGGSMTDAMHFAEEWTGRFRSDRKPYPAMALADPAHLSCVANDYGFEFGFSRMVDAFARPNDLLILLSTSGNSVNLLRAAEAAKKIGCFVFGFLGRGGGPLLELCDQAIIAPGTTADRIQELHLMSLHILIEATEELLA